MLSDRKNQEILTNYFDKCICQKILIYMVKKHLAHEICQGKLDCVKGA